jgi:hypothetical protein
LVEEDKEHNIVPDIALDNYADFKMNAPDIRLDNPAFFTSGIPPYTGTGFDLPDIR